MVVEEFLEENNDRIKISLIHEKFLERHLKSDVYQKSIKEEGAPSEERKKVMELLFDVFQKEIFVWKNFGIKLPHSVIAEQNLFVSNSQLFQDDLHLNELHDVALGPDGRQKKVPVECLQQIKERGKFAVESNRFKGKKHVWQLSPLVIRGIHNLRDDLYLSFSFALSQVRHCPLNRIYGDSPSIWNGVKYIGRSFKDLIKSTIGVPELTPNRYWENINHAKIEFLLGDFYQSFENALKEYQILYQKNNANNTNELVKFWAKNGILERTKKRNNPKLGRDIIEEIEELDWRLFNQLIIDDVNQVIGKLLNSLNQSWNNSNKEFIESIVSELPVDLSPNDVQKFVIKKSEKYCRELIFKRIITEFDRHPLRSSMGIMVVKYFKLKEISNKIDKKWDKIITKTREKITEEIKEKHPIRYHIKEFNNEYFQRRLKEEFNIDEKIEFEKYILEQKYNQLIDQLNENNEFDFNQEIYLISREKEWSLVEEKKAEERCKKIVAPVRVYCWRKFIWNPENWIINTQEDYLKNKSYYAITYTEHSVNSSSYFWRIKNIFVRSSVWFSNNLFRFYQNTINGPFGIRTLYKTDLFYPRKRLDQKTGKLITDKNYRVMPVIYRVKELFRSINKSRNDFEALPDNGFLGKDISRIFNLIWNYLLVLPAGLTFALGITPITSITNIIISTLLLITTIATAPLAAIIKYIFTIFFYDEETCRSSPVFFPLFNSILLNCGIKGIIQILFAILFSILIHPSLAIISSLHAILKYLLLRIWDFLIFFLVIKRKAKIPISNTFVAKRISGPGLNREYFFQISPDSAIISLMIYLEKLELDTFEEQTNYELNEPLRHYNNVVHQMIGSIANVKEHKIITKNINNYRKELEEKLRDRRKILPNHSLSSGSIRQRPDDFLETIDRSNRFVKQFVSENIFEKIYKNDGKKIAQFWSSLQIERGNWAELTNYYLTAIFGGYFLQPLSEDDTTLELQIDKASKVSNFLHMIASSDIHDDLSRHRVRLAQQTSKLTRDFTLSLISPFVAVGAFQSPPFFPYDLTYLEEYISSSKE